MAEIYTVCGRYDEAIDELLYLFSIETDFTINDLKFDKIFEPILAHPRYKELVDRYKATWGDESIN